MNDFDEGKGVGDRIIADDFINAGQAPGEAAVGQTHLLADDDDIKVINICLGHVNGVAGNTLDKLGYRGRVEGAHTRVAGLHGLKGDGAFNATDFADDDKVRPLPQGGFEQVEHGYFGAHRLLCRSRG